MNELQSKTISYIRYPLIVAVIFLHSYNNIKINIENLTFFDNFRYIFSQIIARIAVPVFFFISGYLFFFKIKKWSKKNFFLKIHKRIFTLVIPYLFWNFSYFLILFIIANYFPTNIFKSILNENYTTFNLVKIFWSTNINNSSTPLLYQFWFIRDLIIICLLSPIVYFIVKYLKIFGIIIFGICWFFRLYNITGLGNDSVFFFILGSFFSIHHKNIIDYFNQFFSFSLFLYPVFIMIDLYSKNYNYNLYLHNLGILIGIIFIFNITSYGIQNNIIIENKFLTKTSFFLFAIHEPTLTIINKLLLFFVFPWNEFYCFVIYLIPGILVIVISIIIYKFLYNIFPSFLKIITGGR